MRLRSSGWRVGFVSNNSARTVEDVVDRLGRAHIDAAPSDVVTSAQAAATYLRSALSEGDQVLVVGGAGIVEALEAQELVPVVPNGGSTCRAVVVGYDPAFDYQRLDAAMQAIRAGALYVATNTDATLPVEGGVRPGAGAIVAAVSAAAEVSPLVAGKPHEPIAELVRRRLGTVGLVVGDRIDTDGALADTLGWPFGLVLSGATTRPPDPAPRFVASDLAELAGTLTKGPGQLEGRPS